MNKRSIAVYAFMVFVALMIFAQCQRAEAGGGCVGYTDSPAYIVSVAPSGVVGVRVITVMTAWGADSMLTTRWFRPGQNVYANVIVSPDAVSVMRVRG